MSKIQEEIKLLSDRLTVIADEIKTAEASAVAHETAARADRLRMTELKIERETLNKQIGHSRVIGLTEQAAADAQAASKQAQEHLAEAAKQREAADKLLAELAEQKQALDQLLADTKAAPKA